MLPLHNLSEGDLVDFSAVHVDLFCCLFLAVYLKGVLVLSRHVAGIPRQITVTTIDTIVSNDHRVDC